MKCVLGLSLVLILSWVHVEGIIGKCGHSGVRNFTTPRRALSRTPAPHIRSLQSRTSSWTPIRIKAYYGTLYIPTQMQSILKQSVSGAIHWFQKTLSVKPISTSWTLSASGCGSVQFTGPILTDDFTADFVIYIDADSQNNGIAGAGMFCQQDNNTGQPVVGYYYFNGLTHQNVSDEQVLFTTTHEMTHALVFDPNLYTEYRKNDGTKYSNSEIFLTETMRGAPVLKLVLPTIVTKARAGFGCSTLDGVELESEGTLGTIASHWEKRLMYNDYMVADSSIFDIIYSDVTVALFQDSGWYQVSYQYADRISFGFNESCGFLSQNCVINSQPIAPEFCVEQEIVGRPRCDFLHLRKGLCNLVTFTDPIPSQNQYFGNVYQGGSDKFLQYCPVVKPGSNGNCRDPTRVALNVDYGEVAGMTSRCVEGTYSLSGATKEHAGCHKVTCNATSATLTIGQVQVQCPFTGGDVSIPGFSGVVHCPASDVLCRAVPCINHCYGLGYCQNSQCVCDDGTKDCVTSYSYGFLKLLPILLFLLDIF